MWLDTRNIKDPSILDKLKPRRYSLFKITKVHSKLAYELILPKHWKIHPIFHAILLSYYQTNDLYGKIKAVLVHIVIKGQEEYEIDKVLYHQWT